MKDKKIGRLALRHEGMWWKAYYAMPNTMENAVYLGEIAIRFVYNEPRKEAFMNLMREAVADIIEEQVGERPIWPHGPEPAPESERSGHG
jgi:hypothetical protein